MKMMMVVLLLLLPGVLTDNDGRVPFYLSVRDSRDQWRPQTYDTYVVSGGILLGAMKRLNDSSSNFTFSYTEDPNYGPYLQSVNGVAGSTEDHTYWELLVKKTNGTIIRATVGIGCYIPKANEEVILNFTQWENSGNCRFSESTLESAEGQCVKD